MTGAEKAPFEGSNKNIKVYKHIRGNKGWFLEEI